MRISAWRWRSTCSRRCATDLRIIVMSATLDVERVSTLLGERAGDRERGPRLPGRYPLSGPAGGQSGSRTSMQRVDPRGASWRERDRSSPFCRGRREIPRTAERLEGRLPADVTVAPLYGNLSQKEQDAAIRPPPEGTRKIVLATSIAETSITIDGVRIVIDSGLQRLPVFEPSTGITRLETVRGIARLRRPASRPRRPHGTRYGHPAVASGQTAALPAFTPPQILSSDLSGLVLDLAHWGGSDPPRLPFSTSRPQRRWQEARSVAGIARARSIEAGMLTAEGRAHPRSGVAAAARGDGRLHAAAGGGHAGEAACWPCCSPNRGSAATRIDLEERLAAVSQRARGTGGGFAATGAQDGHSIGGEEERRRIQPGTLLMHAFPDRIALAARRAGPLRHGQWARRGTAGDGAAGRRIDAGHCRSHRPGRRAAHPCRRGNQPGRCRSRDAGTDRRARIRCVFDRQSRQVRARRVTRLGAIVLEETPLPRPTGPASAKALAEGGSPAGASGVCPFREAAAQLRDRIGFLNRTHRRTLAGHVGDEGAAGALDTWFIPFQEKTRGHRRHYRRLAFPRD